MMPLGGIVVALPPLKPRNWTTAIEDLDAVGALAVVAVAAFGADDEHGSALAAARLIARHGGLREVDDDDDVLRARFDVKCDERCSGDGNGWCFPEI